MERRKTRKRVLIVDDDLEYLSWIGQTLHDNFIVAIATDKAEAEKKILESKKPAVILVNIGLNGGTTTGVDLAQECRDLYPEIGVILISEESKSFDSLHFSADECLEKFTPADHLKATIENVIYQKQIPRQLRLRRFELLHGLPGKSSIVNVRKRANYDENGGVVESLTGICAEDNEKIKWVAYKLREHNKNVFTIGIASAIGCKRSCWFCLHGQRRPGRVLSTGEKMGQILHGLDSYLAQGVFEEKSQLSLCISDTVSGDMLIDGMNVGASVIAQYSEIKYLKIWTIITSIGSVQALKKYYRKYIWLPRVQHYWSANFLNEELRDMWMPDTAGESLQELIDHWIPISEESGEKITVSYMVLAGVNDDPREFAKGLKIFRGREDHFKFKLQPYTRPDHPHALPLEMVPSMDSIQALHKVVKDHGLRSRIRKVIGWEILASCGATIVEK